MKKKREGNVPNPNNQTPDHVDAAHHHTTDAHGHLKIINGYDFAYVLAVRTQRSPELEAIIFRV